MTKRASVVLLAAGLVTVAALGLLLLFGPSSLRSFFGFPSASLHEDNPDPRRAYAGPFQNVNPEVHYVSDARCAVCHPDQARDFAQHPMGRSLLPISKTVPPPEDQQHNNPFLALGSRFEVVHDKGKTLHRRSHLGANGRPVADLEWEIHYALGSGTHGLDYLSDREGYLFETPISWFSQKRIWDLSPGFRKAQLTGRSILPECFFCHANRAHHVAGSINHYAEPIFDGDAIGCQRCHGPGDLHVARRPGAEVDGPDYSIVNPRHLEPALREAVCEQCHVQGKARIVRRGRDLYDFRPGMPLEAFWSVFVSAPDAPKELPKAVGHVDQMYQSRCFQGSASPGQLGCISCHDPHKHEAPAERVAHYRSRCLQCHRDDKETGRQGDKETRRQGDKETRRQSGVVRSTGCTVPAAERLKNGDSCIDCHMPRYKSDIPHAASTDHRILRIAQTSPPKPGRPAPRPDGFSILSFYPSPTEGNDEEIDRARAIALVKLALAGDPSAVSALGQARAVLEAAVRRAPDDLAAGEARGYALVLQNRWSEGLAAFQAVLSRDPNQEMSLIGAAATAENLRDSARALDFWRQTVVVNPWEPGYRGHLAQLLIKKEAWAEALAECQAWIRLDPANADARAARIVSLLGTGNKAEARAEFARVEALAPANLRELQIRFENKLK